MPYLIDPELNEDMPSLEYDLFWIRAFDQTNRNALPNKLWVGKWMPFVPISALDETWRTVKQATENGKLGYESKTSTMKPNPNARSDAKVMCIWSNDFRDIEGTRRVLIELRELGFNGRLNYKEDNATYAGVYQNRKTPSSLYTSPSGDTIKILRRAYDEHGEMTIDLGKVGAYV
jgi:hypothetical protein